MISRESIIHFATKSHTRVVNVAREYVQHLFLRSLYTISEANSLLFKGGTALRIVYNSPRFSEDLDFSTFGLTVEQVERLFLQTLADLEQSGLSLTLDEKSHETSGGYYGEARVIIYEYTVILEINVNAKVGDCVGEFKLIHNELVPNYGLQMLPESVLVEEKIQALLTRRKPRDFYDLYFMLRANVVPLAQRNLLGQAFAVVEATEIDFRQELTLFLPQDHQGVIRDFKNNLLSEIKRNIA